MTFTVGQAGHLAEHNRLVANHVSAYGVVGDGSDESVAMQAALDATAATGGVIHLGGMSVTAATALTVAADNVMIDLDGGSLYADVAFSGTNLTATAPATVTLTGAWAAFPVGTTTVSGDFSAFSPGDTIAISLTDAGSASFNQIGRDYVAVSTADGSSLTFTPATRYAYQNPAIQKAEWVAVTGPIAAGSSTFTATAPAGWVAGDLLRVVNVDGTDSADGSTNYFELVRITSIVGTTITLDDNLAYDYGDVQLVKIDAIHDVGIRNGWVDEVIFSNVVGVTATDVRSARIGHGTCYDVTCANLVGEGNGSDPIVINWTHCRHLSISNVRSSGARGSTDNGSIKLMSPVDATITGVQGWDNVATGQGIYPLFVDYLLTPYASWWQNVSISGVSTQSPRSTAAGTRAAWFTGGRRWVVNGITSPGYVRVNRCTDFVVTGATVRFFQLADVTRAHISGFSAEFFDISGTDSSQYGPGVITGPSGANNNRALWIRQSATINPSPTNDLTGIKFTSVDAGDDAIYASYCAGLFITACSTSATVDAYQDGGNNTDVVITGSSFAS